MTPERWRELEGWLVYLANEPRLMHLRGDPQFDALVSRVHRILHRTSGGLKPSAD